MIVRFLNDTFSTALLIGSVIGFIGCGTIENPDYMSERPTLEDATIGMADGGVEHWGELNDSLDQGMVDGPHDATIGMADGGVEHWGELNDSLDQGMVDGPHDAAAGPRDVAVEREGDFLAGDQGIVQDQMVMDPDTEPDDEDPLLGATSDHSDQQVGDGVTCEEGCAQVLRCWPAGTDPSPCLEQCHTANAPTTSRCLRDSACVDHSACYDWSVVESVSCEQACQRLAFCDAQRAVPPSRECLNSCARNGTAEINRCLVSSRCTEVERCF